MSRHCFVIKCGGSTLAALPDSFFEDIKHLQQQGIMAVIVHGGGPAITDMLSKLNIESSFVEGLRVTDDATLDVVEMVLSGQMNKQIVRRIQSTGIRAIGLSGVDGHLIEAEPVTNHEKIGFVGDVIQVNVTLLQQILDMGYIPVIAPIGISPDGKQRFNINADTVAGSVASFLKADPLIVVTDVPGIMRTIEGQKIVCSTVTVQEAEEMMTNGEIYGGMIPKVRAAMQCIQGHVKEVIIVHGADPYILSKVLQKENIGTRIMR
jgi:acetylglutamate kinase